MAPERRHARAQRACTYCRQRKMRCTGERPRCKNCEIYDEECVFATTARKSRPTNAAINALLEENRRLREASSTQPDIPPARSPEVEHVAHSDRAQGPQDVSRVHHVSTSPAGPVDASTTPGETPRSTGGVSTYHGPTSTLHEDLAPATRPWMSKEREAWMPKMLVAAAAEQRQYEGINLRAGKLDFDGVEPELGMHLLNLHWNRQHHAFQVTYRPAFMRDMACNGPYFSKILLNAIYYGASKFSTRLELRKDPDDVRTAGWRFRDRVRDLLGQALDHSEITTIQALLQMSNSLFALGDEQSAAWVYAGTAFRMLVDLGLHVDATMLPLIRHQSEEDLEIRRRVYWSAFVVDKMQSLYQGRPASLRSWDGQVPIVFMDTYEELEFWQPFAYTNETSYPGAPSYSVSTFQQLCKLCIILDDVLEKMYRESKEKRTPDQLVHDLKALESRTHEWAEQLPHHLKVQLEENTLAEIPPPHVLSLHAMWNALRVLLHRPLVADGEMHSKLPSTSKASFATCAEAAMTIVKLVRLYDQAFSIRRAPYLISYATYVAATIHVRIAATRASKSEAHEHLSTCLFVFAQNSETNYAVRKAAVVIEALMARMGVSVENLNSETSSCHPEMVQSGAAAGGALAGALNQSGRNGYDPAVQPSEATALANPEPTMVAGQFVPDLDVDAIIHSFMQDPNFNNPDHGAWSLGPIDYASHNTLQRPPNMDITMNASVMPSNFDDMLFGFNASAFDWPQA